MSIEIMKQVREAFRLCVPMDGYHAEVDAVFKRLDQAIGNAEPQTSLWKEYWLDILKENNDLHERIAKAEKQEQGEPVAWMEGESVYWHTNPSLNDWIRANGTPLYTTPQQRTWVGLTEQEQGAIMESLNAYGTNLYHFANAIEAKLKEKNT